jgi:hypothetical protein
VKKSSVIHAVEVGLIIYAAALGRCGEMIMEATFGSLGRRCARNAE